MSSPASRIVCEKARCSATVASPVPPFFGRLHAVFGGICRNAADSRSTGERASATIHVSVCWIVSFSGAESEESFKDFGKNREAMRLCREGKCYFSFPVGPKVCFGSRGLRSRTGSKYFSH